MSKQLPRPMADPRPINGAPMPGTANRLPCHFKAVAVYGAYGCRRIQEVTIDVTEISRTEIVIQGPLCIFLPNSFTLVLGARQYGMGCVVAQRFKDRLVCKLIRRESSTMVAFLSTLLHPVDTLSILRHPLFPPGRHERIFLGSPH